MATMLCRERFPGERMLLVPPPIWAFIGLLLAGIASVLYPWRAIVDLHVLALGILLVIAGFTISFSAFSLFRREGTEINPISVTNSKLVVRGPYRFTRNPMYLGLVTFTLGIAFWVGSLPMFAVPMLLFILIHWRFIPMEEAKMRRQFGASFDDYAGRVRRWV